MSDRIDLTQFEGIWNKKHLLLVEKTPTDGFHWSVGFENDVEASMSVPSEFGREIHEEADRFYNAIDKLPELIAELKRCYELIDAQKENLEFFNGAIEKLHEDTWFDAVTNLVEEHHPSEWCDYAVCWKCDEETTSE